MNYIRMYKSGKFYNAFCDDGIILHFLLGYKYLEHKKCVGFPAAAYTKVKQKLESEKLSYQIFEKEELIEEYKGISKNYKIILKKALNSLDVEARMNRLNKIIENLSEKELNNLIEVIENGSFK